MTTAALEFPRYDPPMLEPGAKAPDFTLPDQDGNDVHLAALRGKIVVLYFYPKADTPGRNPHL